MMISTNDQSQGKMKNKNTIILSTALLMTAPAFSATPDDNDNGVKQTLTINQETVEGTVSEIRLDGNNAVLQFTDGTTLTADMRLVTLTMSYDEATKANQLRVTDKEGEVKVYDLQGRRVDSSKLKEQSSQSDIIIVNGRKVRNKRK